MPSGSGSTAIGSGSAGGSGGGWVRSTRKSSDCAGSGGAARRPWKVSGGGALSPRRAARSAAARARSSGLRSEFVECRRGTYCLVIVTGRAVGRAATGSALFGREQQRDGLAGVVTDQRELAVDGHHQALRVHVGRLERDRLELARRPSA